MNKEVNIPILMNQKKIFLIGTNIFEEIKIRSKKNKMKNRKKKNIKNLELTK